jgi:predicted amidohydrolase YtcJ
LLGIHAAVTRQDQHDQPSAGWYPQERLSVADAIRAYTLGAAYAAGKQRVQGSISPGKWADLIALSHDLSALPPETLKEAQVALTIFDGKIVHSAL